MLQTLSDGNKRQNLSEQDSRTARGFGMLGVLLLSFVGFSLAAAALVFARHSSKSTQSFAALSARDDLAALIESVAEGLDFKIIAVANSANSRFAACLSTTSVCPVGSNPSDVGPLTLFDGKGRAISGPFSGTLSGGSLPVNAGPGQGYRLDGMRCSALSNDCPLEVITSFRSACDGLSAACGRVAILYWVRQNPRFSGKTGFAPVATRSNLDSPLFTSGLPSDPTAGGTAGPIGSRGILSPKGKCIYLEPEFRPADTVPDSFGMGEFRVSCPADYPALVSIDVRAPCVSDAPKTVSAPGPGGFPTTGYCSVRWNYSIPGVIDLCANAPGGTLANIYVGNCEYTCCTL